VIAVRRPFDHRHRALNAPLPAVSRYVPRHLSRRVILYWLCISCSAVLCKKIAYIGPKPAPWCVICAAGACIAEPCLPLVNGLYASMVAHC